MQNRRKSSRQDGGALSVEAAFVIGIVAVFAFVLFPPILKKLNRGAEVVKSKSAIVSEMGIKRAVTYIDTAGTVYLAAPDIVLNGIQATAKNIAIQTAKDAKVKVALIKFEDIDANGKPVSPVVSCLPECCQVYDAATNSFANCDAAEITALQNTALNYPFLEGTSPYAQIVMAFAADGSSLSSGNAGADNTAMGNVPQEVTIYSGIGLMHWGNPPNAYAELFDAAGALRCPLRAEDPKVCCPLTRTGGFDLSSCAPCTARDLHECVAEG